MTARNPSQHGEADERRPTLQHPGRPEPSSAEAEGPEAVGPWGWGGRFDEPAPWGVAQDSPMDEGSEPTAVTEGRRGERRAAPPAGAEPTEKAGRHGFGPVEPTRTREAGPGGPPDPAPHRRSFPEPFSTDPPDNPIERQTGGHTRGTSRRRGI